MLIKNQFGDFWRFIQFSLIGVSNLILDTIVYYVLSRFFAFYYIMAKAVSFLAAVSWSFFWNRHWTFQNQTKPITASYAKFFIVSILNFFGGLGLFFFAVEHWRIYDLTAVVAVSFLTAITGFYANKLWTFKSN